MDCFGQLCSRRHWCLDRRIPFRVRFHPPLLSLWTLFVLNIVADALRRLSFLGRRWFIIGGSICGILGCIVGASANTVNQGMCAIPIFTWWPQIAKKNPSIVIAGQAILGFSGGASFMTFACIAELVSRRQRGPTLAAVNLFASIWTVAGSLIGTLILPTLRNLPIRLQALAALANKAGHAMVLSAGGWRSVFYQSLAIDVFATLLAWRFYHPAPPLSEQIFTRREILRNFDYPGLLAMTVCSNVEALQKRR